MLAEATELRPPAVDDPAGRFAQPKRRAPNGRPLCRWCHAEVPKGRQSWCSQQCVDAYLARKGWQHLYSRVKKRDHGLCAICGVDTEKQIRICRWALVWTKRFDCYSWEWYRDLQLQLGMAPHLSRQWQADHIVPRSKGGLNILSNLRTLCIECHKHVTAKQAKLRRKAS